MPLTEDYGLNSPRTWANLSRYLTRLVGCRTMADDLAHDAYVKGRNLEDKTGIELTTPRLFVISFYLALRARRKRRDFVDIDGVDPPTLDPEESAHAEALYRALDLGLDSLAHSDRELALAEYPLHQIATAQSISYAAARQRRRRVLVGLRGRLGPLLFIVLAWSILTLYRSGERVVPGRASGPGASNHQAPVPPAMEPTILLQEVDRRPHQEPIAPSHSIPDTSTPPAMRDAASPSPQPLRSTEPWPVPDASPGQAALEGSRGAQFIAPVGSVELHSTVLQTSGGYAQDVRGTGDAHTQSGDLEQVSSPSAHALRPSEDEVVPLPPQRQTPGLCAHCSEMNVPTSRPGSHREIAPVTPQPRVVGDLMLQRLLEELSCSGADRVDLPGECAALSRARELCTGASLDECESSLWDLHESWDEVLVECEGTCDRRRLTRLLPGISKVLGHLVADEEVTADLIHRDAHHLVGPD